MNLREFVPDMTFFWTTRAKRTTAYVVLLVWLFAVASGVANACLLDGPGTHSHSAAAGPAKTGHAPALLAGPVGAVDGHDDDSDTSKESCVKVCDDGSIALVKLQTGFDLGDPGMAPLVAMVWNAAAPVLSGPCRLVDLQPPIVGPPFRVRYSRLAL
jgi:hypothetical protein